MLTQKEQDDVLTQMEYYHSQLCKIAVREKCGDLSRDKAREQRKIRRDAIKDMLKEIG